MKKGLALVLAMLLVWVVAAPVFAAGNPFADVPADHWAYDSIVELAAAGLVEGYPDGEFKGERNFTRYEMAMVFARMLGRMESYVDYEMDEKIGGLSDEILDKVAKDLAEKIDASRAELTALIKETVDKKAAELPEKVVERVVVEKPGQTVVERVVEKPVREVVEKVVVEKPVQTTTTIYETVEKPFELTDEAKAVLAKFVADSVASELANIEPKTIERIVETKIVEKEIEPDSNTLTRDEINELIAIATAAEMLSDSNSRTITSLDEAIKAADEMIKALKEELGLLKARVEGDAATAAAEDAKLANDIADVKVELSKTNEGLAATDTELAKTQEELAKTQEELAQVNTDLAAASGEALVNAAEIAETSAALAKTQEELAATNEKLAEVEAQAAENKAGVEENAGTILVHEGYIAQNAADIERTKSDVDALKMLLLGLEENLGGVKAELSDKIASLEEQIAKMAIEFETELAVLGVRVSQLEYVFKKLETRVEKLEVAQKATAEEFAAFKAEHEKVKITGETNTVADVTRVELIGDYAGPAYKDPRKHDFDDDDATDDADDYYVDNSVLKQELALTLTATPAEGVTVTAELDADVDVFGGTEIADDEKDSFSLDLTGLTLSVTTEGVLRSLYAGEMSNDDLTARFHGLVFDPDVLGDDDHNIADPQVLSVNLVNGRLDTQVTFFRPGEAHVVAVDQEFKLNENATFNGEAVFYSANPEAPSFEGQGAYLASLYGNALGLDYDFDLATTDFANTNKGAFALEIGKELGFVNLSAEYTTVAPGYDAEFGSYTAGERRLYLGATDMTFLGATTSAEYTYEAESDFKAWKLAASKEVEIGLPFTLTGSLASNGTLQNQKFGVALTDYAVTEKLTLSAGYNFENNVIDDTWTVAGSWKEKDTRKFDTEASFALTENLTVSGGYIWENTKADDASTTEFEAKTTTTLGAEYMLTVGSADVTAGYEWKKVDDKTADPDVVWNPAQNTYSLKIEAPFFGANLTTEGKLVTGYNAEFGEETTDKVASFELAYPIVDDVNFTFGGTYVNSEDVDGNGYTVKKLDGGVTFKF